MMPRLMGFVPGGGNAWIPVPGSPMPNGGSSCGVSSSAVAAVAPPAGVTAGAAAGSGARSIGSARGTTTLPPPSAGDGEGTRGRSESDHDDRTDGAEHDERDREPEKLCRAPQRRYGDHPHAVLIRARLLRVARHRPCSI